MKQKKLLALAAVAAITGLASQAALASASASATLSNFTITLYDLNPLDNIAPSVVFTHDSGSYAYASEFSVTPSSYVYDGDYAGTVFGSASKTVSGPAATGSASIAGSTISTSASVAPGGFTNAWGVAYLGDGGTTASFTLSADTVLVISATSSLAASTTSSTLASSGAYAILQLFGSDANSSQQSSASFATYAGYNYGYPNSTSAGGAMAVSYVNPTSTGTTGNFYGLVESWAQSSEPVSAVPEPENMALLAAGLGMLGLLARRRARQG